MVYLLLELIKHTSMKPIVLTSIVSAVIPISAAAQQRPNIIYIFTDQQTASAMSCAGNTDVNTPNMDRLAANGVRFENAYCTAPLSGPSRASMFTGHYPGTTGMLVNGAPLPDSLKNVTLGTLVQAAGYECAYAGKWHVSETSVPDGVYGFKQLHPHNDIGLAEACVKFLSQKHDKPFFLVASFDNPHNICEYARRQNLPYGNIPEPEEDDCPGLPANFAKNPFDAGLIGFEQKKNYSLYPAVDFTVSDWRKYRYVYYRLVEKVDAEIGKIVDAIEKNGLWKNSVVIFTSDHGDGVGAHGWNQKSALYEEVANIPLIVTLPGKKQAGKVARQLVSNGIDFFASVCDWAGAEKPAGVEGVSYRRIAESGGAETGADRSYIVCETQFDTSTSRGWMLRTERYKYVLYDKGSHREQLFDMTVDRGEMRNLAVEKAYRAELEKCRDLLHQWLTFHRIKTTRKNLNDVPNR